MGKKEEYEILASQYFVERGYSITNISKKLPVSEKTLFTWKKQGEWDKKRARFLKSQYSCNTNLYELLNLVVQKALDDFHTDGTMPEQKTLYFIMNMAGKLKDLKAFEEAAAEEKIKEANSEEEVKEEKINTEEVLQKIIKAMTA